MSETLPADDDDWDDLPVLRPARRRERPWLRVTLTSAAIVAGLAYLAERRQAESEPAVPIEVPPSALTAPPSPWQPIPPGAALFELEGMGALEQESRRHAEGGREDTLMAGMPGDAGHMRLRVRRDVADPGPSSFYVDLARQAAEAGLSVTRSGQSAPLHTKLGIVEIAAVTLAAEGEQACQAFRFVQGEPAFAVQGWLCGTPDLPVTPAHLACLIDRLAVAGTGDPALAAVFAAAERQRVEGCGAPARMAGIRRPEAGQP
jgi:hypothetical protein